MTPNFKIFLAFLIIAVIWVVLLAGCASAPVQSTAAPGVISIIGYGGCGGIYNGAVLVNKRGDTLMLDAKQLPVESAQKIADGLPDDQVESLHICSGGLETHQW